MIAVDMLTHSFRRNMHEATLLTGDLDFKPLVDALVQEGTFVTLWYPPGETSKELIAAADRSERFSIRSVYDALPNPRPFAIPHSYNSPSKGNYAPILKKVMIDEDEIIVMKDEKTFVLAVPDRLNPGHMSYHEHLNMDILRAYVEEVFGLTLPALDYFPAQDSDEVVRADS